MQLVSTLLPLLLASTFTSAIPVSGITRSASTILSDIDSISSDVATFTKIAVAWNGNIVGLAALCIILQKLESDLTTTAYAIASLGTFNSTDSKSILLSVTTLTPTIVTLLSDLDAKVSLCDEVVAQMTDKFD